MSSPENRALIESFRNSPALEGSTFAEWRASLDRLYEDFPMPENIRDRSVTAGNIPGAWFSPGEATGCKILHLHGGGFAMGSVKVYRAFSALLAHSCTADVLSIDYRLAPENPFPAALDDALAAYEYLLSNATPDQSVAIIGDSAGGGLAASLLLQIREKHLRPPSCAVLISPWLDLTLSGESVDENASLDPLVSREGMQAFVAAYAGDVDTRSPLVSPLFGQWDEQPPLLILASTTEVLRDDSIYLAQTAQKAGVDVELVLGEECVHVWPQYAHLHPEGRETLATIGTFVGNHCK